MIDRLNDLLWGKMMILLLAFLGAKLLLSTRFYPLRRFGRVWRLTLGTREKSKKGLSSFQAMCTALGGTIGVGNTVGVAVAISVGGPGAVFWMLVSAFFAMIIKFCEVWLCAVYRDESLGFGGPMHYIRRLLHAPVLANFFSLCVLPASLFVGNLAQSDLVCSSVEQIFSVPAWIAGFLLALAVGTVILGGSRRIHGCTSFLVPLMSAAYLGLCLILLFSHASRIPSAVQAILQGAFSPGAALGGVGGFGFSKAVSCGFSKGMFSNEAGMGSAPMAHTQSGERDPEKQGAWGILEVFIDTVLICLLTALVILTCSQATADPMQAVLLCFTRQFQEVGAVFFVLSMTLFAFASMCAWSLYADCALLALRAKAPLRFLFRLLFTLVVPLAAFLSTDTILKLSDLFNALMALPNVLALWIISSQKSVRERWREL